jgi:threonine/homoserine/homoserine lactone efflux protein
MFERPDLLVPFIIFSVVAFFTPGPNNLMLLTSGLTFGFRRTWPAMLGVAFGYVFFTLCIGLGLGALFIRYPTLYIVIKYAGAAYMLYLAWAIANSEPPNPDIELTKQPITFWRVCALQWVNPKGLAMGVSAISSYSALMTYPYNILFMATLYAFIGVASSVAWAGMGMALQRFLHQPKLVRAFNIVMAMLLAASLYPVFAEAWTVSAVSQSK